MEDPCICVGPRMVLNQMGHPTRRKEVGALERVLREEVTPNYKNVEIYDMREASSKYNDPRCDGGDVLYIPPSVSGKRKGELLVGLSERSNVEGAKFLEDSLQVRTRSISVGKKTLHLKSVVTLFQVSPEENDDSAILVIADNEDGHAAWDEIKRGDDGSYYVPLWVPEALASNVLRIPGKAVFCAANCEKSLSILRAKALPSEPIVEMDQSELAKADGALTCCSLLLHLT